MDNEEKEIIWKMPFNSLKDKAAKEYMIKGNELNIKTYIATKSVKR